MTQERFQRSLLRPFKGDPDTLIGLFRVIYGRPRPYRLPDGRQIAPTREPVWEREGQLLVHLTAPGTDANGEAFLQKLILRRVSVAEYEEGQLADPERCETKLRIWGRSYDLDFARIEDLLALAEAFLPPACLWRELGMAPSTPRRIVAPGTWHFGDGPRRGMSTVPERLFPALSATGGLRGDGCPRRARLHSLPVGEAFGFKARFHYILFAERKATHAPPP